MQNIPFFVAIKRQSLLNDTWPTPIFGLGFSGSGLTSGIWTGASFTSSSRNKQDHSIIELDSKMLYPVTLLQKLLPNKTIYVLSQLTFSRDCIIAICGQSFSFQKWRLLLYFFINNLQKKTMANISTEEYMCLFSVAGVGVLLYIA